MAFDTRRVWQAAATILALLVIVLAYWLFTRKGTGRSVPEGTPYQRQALEKYLRLTCEVEIDPKVKTQFDSILVSSGVLDNRLLHDCQKLMLNRNQYGPMVGLQVADGLDGLIDQVSSGVVLADIVDFDHQNGYPNLDIHPELNCLWVKGDDPAHPEAWRAAVRQGASCRDTATLSTVTHYLRVETVPYVTSGTHPGTARWGWDGTTQYIGIHCGKYWCEIGRADPQNRRHAHADSLGLSDEQYIAAFDNSAAGKVRPAYVWGRIKPYPILANPDSMVYRNPQRVATILLTSDTDDPAPPAPTNTQVNLHYQSQFSLKGDSTDLFMKFDLPSRTFFIATDTVRANWTKLNRCPWQHAAVGAVRWRWSAADEAIWLACSVGCCNTTDIGLQQ